MKIAIIHDYLEYWGGAERVLATLLEMFPQAEVFTLIYDEEKIGKFLGNTKIHTSCINKLPKFIKKRKRYLLPIIPSLPETFDLRDFDVVISSSGAFAKGVVVRPKTVHICYCHSPMRFAWDWYWQYKKEQRKGPLTRAAICLMTNYLRVWDFSSSQRVDYFIANSQNVSNRIKKYYRKDSKVIYPPVESPQKIQECGRENYFLIISRLSPYKRVDLAIEAFNKLHLPLVIAGDGSEMKRLKKMSGPNVEFVGNVSDGKKWGLLAKCRALIFPGDDDFGITMVEAMMMGKPVMAFRGGGALEIVQEGKTGEFFNTPSVEILAEGIKRLRENFSKYDTHAIKKEAQKFSKERFKREFLEYFNSIVNNAEDLRK